MNNPTVSVLMITYGHEKYIAQAIDGVLMQETNFQVELIIANDHSPDNTDTIVRKYINENSKGDLIKNFNHDKNLGMMPNFLFALEQTEGEYIAMCEGDDYWTDPLKLQKQVDFLEKNTEYSMICHDALIIDEINNSSKLYFGPTKKKQICSTKDTLNIQFCPTASIVFRKQALLPLSNLNFVVDAGDQALVQLISLNGLLYRMYEVMSVYRVTSTGASQVNRRNIEGSLEKRINALKNLNKISNYKYQKYIRIENLLIQNRIDLLSSKSKVKTIFLKFYRRMLSFIKSKI